MNPKIQHKINRLKHLEWNDIRSRIRKKIWHNKTRKLAESGQYNLNQTLNELNDKTFFDIDSQPHFFFEPDEEQEMRKLFKTLFADRQARLLEKAERIRNHEFKIFNKTAVFDREIDWHSDPLTGGVWPIVYFQDIRYTGEGKLSDIKYVWELNRHQHLVTLGQAYFLSTDERFSKEIVNQISSWIDTNKPFMGVNWMSPMEIALRMISWAWALHFIRESQYMNSDFSANVLASVDLQSHHIENLLSEGYYANNHLMGEAAGLVISGLYFNSLKQSSNRVRRGLAILQNEIAKQILPDGGGAEQAPEYLAFVIEFILLSFILAGKNMQAIFETSWHRLEKSIEFTAYSIMPNGLLPRFGDADDGRVVNFGGGEYYRLKGILNIGAELFNRPDLKFLAGGITEHVLWLRGIKGLNRLDSLKESVPDKNSRIFKHSGYAMLRSSWDADARYLIMDFGPIGYRTGAHGHADLLSVQIMSAGEEILTDPGTFAYNQGEDLRNYFRSTRVHNTITVDGVDQAKITDRMAWRSIPNGKIVQCCLAEEFSVLSAEHDGYACLSSPVVHKRFVLFSNNPFYYIIVDKMVTSGRHQYGMHFHFAPETQLSLTHNGALIDTGKQKWQLAVSCPKPLGKEILGDEGGRNSWYSRGYGHLQKSPAFEVIKEWDGPIWLATLLVFNPKDAEGQLRQSLFSDTCLRLDAQIGGSNHTWLLSEGDNRVRMGDIGMEGEIACIDNGEKKKGLFGLNLRWLQADNIALADYDVPFSGVIFKQ